MNVYAKKPSLITIANFDKVVLHLPKHQSIGKVVDATVRIVHIKDECDS